MMAGSAQLPHRAENWHLDKYRTLALGIQTKIGVREHPSRCLSADQPPMVSNTTEEELFQGDKGYV